MSVPTCTPSASSSTRCSPARCRSWATAPSPSRSSTSTRWPPSRRSSCRACPALNQIVLKAIAKDPDQRYQTAEQFARDLRSAQVGGPVAAAAFDPGAEATRLMGAGTVAGAGATSVMTGGPLAQTTGDRGRRRRRWRWVLVIVLLLLVIAAAAGEG